MLDKARLTSIINSLEREGHAQHLILRVKSGKDIRPIVNEVRKAAMQKLRYRLDVTFAPTAAAVKIRFDRVPDEKNKRKKKGRKKKKGE